MTKRQKKNIQKNLKRFVKKFAYRFASRLLEITGLLAIGYMLGLHLVRY